MDEQDKLHPLYGKGLPSPAQAGAELRGQVQNLQDFGSTVGRMASGVAAAPGQALAGMRDTAAPYLDRRFAEMEAQGRGFMQGVNDFRRGFAGSNVNFPYAEDASALEAQLGRAKAASANADRLLYGSGGNADGIRGWAARNNPNPKPYQAPQGLPTSSNDTYGQMAQMLAGQSQQRFDPYAQLQRMQALNAMTPYGTPPGAYGASSADDGPFSIGGQAAAEREKTERWAREDWLQKARNNPNLQGVISQLIQSENTGAINERNDATRRIEAGLNRDAQVGMESLRNHNAIALEGMRGQNQLAAYGMQGQNQLANTLLGYGMQGQNQLAADGRRYGLEMDTLGMEQEFRLPLLNAQVGEANSRAGLMQQQGATLKGAMDFDKTADASIQKWMKMYLDTGIDPDTAKREAIRMYIGSRREAKANGGVVGYAEGGAVDPIEEAYRRAGIQRPQQFREQEKQQGLQRPEPAPVSQAAPQQAPAPQPSGRGIFGILGGRGKQIDAAAGYARGGAVKVGGKQVLGPGTGKSDSIPAVIDGKRPAALSTGEFVMPVETVRHFGLDKLNKMVAQSRKGLDTGRRQA